MRNVTPGIARSVSVVDCDELPDDRHKRAVLKELNRITVVQPSTEPMSLTVEIPPRITWAEPVRRHPPGRYVCTPDPRLSRWQRLQRFFSSLMRRVF